MVEEEPEQDVSNYKIKRYLKFKIVTRNYNREAKLKVGGWATHPEPPYAYAIPTYYLVFNLLVLCNNYYFRNA